MPIEVKELHIRINVDEQQSRTSRGQEGLDRQQLIATCVERVMDIIADKTER